MTHYLEQALKAHAIFHRDKDYIVRDGEVIIVDEFTGRMMIGRRYSEGLHQAIEAKEGVRVRRQNVTMATITFQNYFRMYEKLAGMTGTAKTEDEEFHRDLQSRGRHDPDQPGRWSGTMRRISSSRTRSASSAPSIRDIEESQQNGRPVLVGTTSIETSERLSSMLSARGHRRTRS